MGRKFGRSERGKFALYGKAAIGGQIILSCLGLSPDTFQASAARNHQPLPTPEQSAEREIRAGDTHTRRFQAQMSIFQWRYPKENQKMMRTAYIRVIGRVVPTLLSLLMLSTLAVGMQSPKPLTNDDVIQMVKANFSEETIIKAITANPTNFDTSVQALIALKQAKVSEKIINAMLASGEAKENTTTTKPSDPLSPDVPPEIGVYIKDKGKLVEVQPEIVNWRTGGVLKSVATVGLTKGHVNGTINKPHSPLQTSAPVEFIIRCPEGTVVTEYQLLRMDEKKDRREFRAMTGGIIHASGGSKKNAVEFSHEKIGPGTYRIQLTGLAAGEYGFLPPGLSSASIGSSGKIYTFGIE